MDKLDLTKIHKIELNNGVELLADTCDGCGRHRLVRWIHTDAWKDGAKALLCQECWLQQMAAWFEANKTVANLWPIYGFMEIETKGGPISEDVIQTYAHAFAAYGDDPSHPVDVLNTVMDVFPPEQYGLSRLWVEFYAQERFKAALVRRFP